jgi:hypothetical protein
MLPAPPVQVLASDEFEGLAPATPERDSNLSSR